jgi:hypothetical protein
MDPRIRIHPEMSRIRNTGQEWEEAAALCGDHFTLVTAFSRDQEEKIYVQHRQGFRIRIRIVSGFNQISDPDPRGQK